MNHECFEPIASPFSFAKAEAELRALWKTRRVYAKSLEQRRGAPRFVFYEGPPTANGMPHPGHCLTRTIKDIFPRYKTMDGYLCERKAGWDTHGLPVEIEVCKELGIIDGGKAAIESYGVEGFNRACLESVFRYQREWEEMTDRIGFWVNLDDAYITYHQSYVESVWWSLKQLFDRGLLYQGHKVVWWWAQGGTALSAGEVGEAYRDTDDPSITVRLALTEASKEKIGFAGQEVSLVIWTTTPWTLSSNCAACVGADIDYVLVRTSADEGREEYLVVAEALLEANFGDQTEVVQRFKGADLVGLQYEPLFKYDAPEDLLTGKASEKHWEVIPGDFVDLSTGTGIVHIAPAFGEDDYRICREQGIGFLCFVRPDGTFDERVTDKDPFDGTPIAGQFCKDADKSILRVLKERGRILRHEQIRHSYPFCPRADKDPLIQYARRSWFIRTSAFRKDFLENNSHIQWQPEHIRDGRFGNFLEGNVDWALSRERYWGTPLPVWVCEKTGNQECIASYDELLGKPGITGLDVWEKAKQDNPGLSEHLKVHKPYIDAVTYQSPWDPDARMRRVSEVIDVWYDSGAMPFAQWGYPHVPGSEEVLAQNFPADFISEGIDQTRGWFYALLAISTLVFDKPKPRPFRNCICLGLVHGEDGLKLSKRLKNYKDPTELFDKYSADALRWSLLAKNPPTTANRLTERNVEEAQREILLRWYNVYSFFVIYANLDGFHPAGMPKALLDALGCTGVKEGAAAETTAPWRNPEDRGELDRWILSELNRVVLECRSALDRFETYPATRGLTAFLDSLSNWYVRRSRARFWAEAWTADKADAYWTLYECLLKFAQLMAPFTPFFADITWQNLSRPLTAPESVHLSPYPVSDTVLVDQQLLDAMAATRNAVNLGLSARRVENIKVRQPLGLCRIITTNPAVREALEGNLALVLEELNIKALEFAENPEAYVSYEIKPNFKLLGPRFGAKMKQAAAALAKGDAAALFAQLQQTGAIDLELDGESVSLTGEEVDVRLQAKEGFAAAQGQDMVVVLSTTITEALRREGWAREFIRGVQELRKEEGLAYDMRIRLFIALDDADLSAAIREHENVIAGEVLAVECCYDLISGDKKHRDITIDGLTARVQIEAVQT
ncbi:MAG: Isoleucine--tRNA ligase [Candidatus Hydrogenedentes bacterium ADurb.Bin170]|nr:MAG: Isoleucine--tRNA ligase [Candidatus Hydrogenedentes bacterium ADurb.Bin170]